MRGLLLGGALLIAVGPAQAQTVTDGSDAALGSDTARAAVALIGRGFKDPASARITGLRPGKAGAVCGEIDRPNRMGSYTGPRRFVTDTAAGFAGVLPDGPELRAPASVADYQVMQRTITLLTANCE